MMSRLLRIAYCSTLILLAGCSSLAPFLSTPTPAPVIRPTTTPEPESSPTAPVQTGPRVLRVWLPPRFDPNADTPSAELLKQRIDEFNIEHPDLEIEIRIKADGEAADLLNSLSITSGAAPAALPDLIMLSHSDMEVAAQRGLLHPIDGLTSILDEPDWYAFARDLGRVQNTSYGLPFSADALMMVYRASVFEEPPSTWEAIFTSGNQMTFPPSDPKAYFPLSLYLSADVPLTGDQGSVILDEGTLAQVLSLFRQAIDSETVPLTIRDDQTDLQALSLFREGEADVAVVWASSDLTSLSGQYLPLMGIDNAPYTVADGWVLALAGADPENQSLAAELASYLVDSDFMSAWSLAAGYLPTRPQALDGWQDEALKMSIDEILQAAHPLPPESVVSVTGPVMAQALFRIFNGEQPEAVARSVIESLE
ncbi:MAG: hypothetical protein C3F07_06995 [Anaerolineales bacterium]|nr:MAG: hypothetical protein C3F07_06995 [Anaerolineales bacterium]